MTRVRRWRGTPLLSYGFRPFFLLAGAWAALAMAIWVAVLSGAPLTSGAIGVMTLAVMTRAALGHTGRPLTAGPVVTAIYALALAAALARVISGVLPSAPGLLHLAAALWFLAFALFALRFLPVLAQRRRHPA